MPETPPELTSDEKKQRSQRNLAIALGLTGFVLVVFLVTILRISANIGGAQ